MQRIEFVDLRTPHREMKKDFFLALENVIERSDYILGEDVKLFEKEFARFCASRYAVGVSSGTAALFLAALSLDIGPGDEVIVPAFTYIATALAVTYTGATPVFVDIEQDTYCLDPELVRKAVTPKTKAIIPVHLYGHPANMHEILKIAKEYNLKIIEDTAQAHGAQIKLSDNLWHQAGNIGDIGCFSFYPSKNLGALGDGGMIVTNDEHIYEKLLMLRDYGRISKYEHVILGYNERLDTLQAAFLRIKLKKLKQWNLARRRVAARYNALLENLYELYVPYVSPLVKHVYHVYAIRTIKRDELSTAFKQKGIPSLMHYPIPLHLQTVYKNLGYLKGAFPVAEHTAQHILSLPIHPHLDESQITYISQVIKEILE
jgi:dTDP-4-amino-4,6-dideoxygalactose transaminase